MINFLLVSVFSVSALQCPEPHEEYQSIMRKLKEFEARLAPQNECRSLQAELADLRVFYSENLKRLKQGLRKTNESTEVSEEEAQSLSDYSTSVATKISSIVAAIQQDNGKCVSKEQQPSFLSSLASIARSATGMVSSFTGPYEIPIRIGGSLFAGILLGIDKIMNGNPKYDFNDSDRHQLFVKNLCIYHDIRQEIQNTLEPIQRLRMYLEIMALLTEKENVIMQACATTSKNCEEYSKRFQEKYSVDSKVDDLKMKLDESAGKASSPWAHCAILSDVIFQGHQVISGVVSTNSVDVKAVDIGPDGQTLPEPKDIFEEIINDVKKTEKAGASVDLMEDTYRKITSSGFIPRRVECWDLSEDEIQSKNKRTRGIIDDIARMAKEHFAARLQELLWPSEDDDVHEKRNYAVWLHKTYLKRLWAFQEVVHMLTILGPDTSKLLFSDKMSDENALREIELKLRDGSDSARQQIRIMMNDLDARVLKDLAPQFISWNTKIASKSLEAYQKRRRQEQSSLRSKMKPYLDFSLDSNASVPDLLTIVECPKHGKKFSPQMCSNVASNISDLLNELGLLKNSLGTIAVYCDFFVRAGTMNDPLLEACSSDLYWETQRSFESLASEKEAYEKYLDWCHIKDNIDGDNARDVIQRIKTFVEDTKKSIPSAGK